MYPTNHHLMNKSVNTPIISQIDRISSDDDSLEQHYQLIVQFAKSASQIQNHHHWWFFYGLILLIEKQLPCLCLSSV